MKKIRLFIRGESGAITAMTVIMMAAFVGILAVVIDMGHLYTVQNEIQNSADAAALAGARTLMPLTGTGAPPWPMEDPPPCVDAIKAAKDTAWVNRTQGGANLKNITIEDKDIVTGVWDFKPVGTKAGTFTPKSCVSGSGTNAVQVTALMRADLSQGSVIMTFAKIFGIGTVDPSATAVAAVGKLQTIPPGVPGVGFLAANTEYMKRLWDEKYGPYWEPLPPGSPYTGPKNYFVFQPAGGNLTWVNADNVGWGLPMGAGQPNPSTIIPIINGGSLPVEISAGETIAQVQNGENTPSIKAIQDHLPLTTTIMTVDTESFNGDLLVQELYTIEITGAWGPADTKDLPLQFLTDNSFIDPKNFKGVLEFYVTGKVSINGEPGGGTPSNTYSMLPKLVDNDSRMKLGN